MELNWKVDFSRGVAVCDAATVSFHERSPREFAVTNVVVGRPGVSRISVSHDALRAIRTASFQSVRR